MDLSTILSIVAIVVSVIVSGITLLLTQFQGPDIELISKPMFVGDYEKTITKLNELLKQSQATAPTWLALRPAPFVFANHGGKSGTILEIDIRFDPETKESEKFFVKDGFNLHLSLSTEQAGSTATIIPNTIKAGDNKAFMASPIIPLVDWKRTALAEVLDPNSKVEDLIDKAIQISRKNFESFCDFMSDSEILGTILCWITYTQGRFRTKIKIEEIINPRSENMKVRNWIGSVEFRKFLPIWADLTPTRTQLLNDIKRDLEGITRELNSNLLTLNIEVTLQTLAQSCLRADAWGQLCNESRPCDEKIHWFLIRSEEGLEQELKDIYHSIHEYNNHIDDVTGRGDFRTTKSFADLNEERSTLKSNVQEVVSRLSELYRRHVSES